VVLSTSGDFFVPIFGLSARFKNNPAQIPDF